MKKTILFLSFIACASFLSAQTYVQPYTKSDGTYVPGHYRSTKDNTYKNNWSTKGNTNPYTGVSGTKNSTYQGSKTIHTGPRGGKYYINSNGNKTYVPRKFFLDN